MAELQSETRSLDEEKPSKRNETEIASETKRSGVTLDSQLKSTDLIGTEKIN